MPHFVKLRRLQEIGKVAVKYGFAPYFPSPVLRIFGIRDIEEGEGVHRKLKELSVGERLRLAFEELGTTYIKLGQLLSTRKDIIPEDVIVELQKLQDHVIPTPFDKMQPIIEEELASPVEDKFSDFNTTPLASASISQVYTATLKENGKPVVLKVRKPGIVGKIKGDMDILFWVADVMQKHSALGQQFDFKGIVTEFFHSMQEELDLNIEKHNTQKFINNFASPEWEWLSFPHMYDEYCTNGLIVMDHIYGKTLYELEGFPCDRKLLAERGARAFMKMVFEDGFFHADLHAGNVFFLLDNRLALLDCGMVGILDQYTRELIAELFLSFAQRDYMRLAGLYIELSDGPEDVDRKELAKDIRRLFEALPGSLGEVNTSEMMTQTFKVLYKHHLRVPRSLTLLIRGVSMVEGMGLELDPEFDFIKQCQTFAGKILKEKYSPDRMAQELFSTFIKFAELMKRLPDDLSEIAEKIENGNLRYKTVHVIPPPERKFISRMVARVAAAFLLAGALIAYSSFRDSNSLYLIFYPLAIIAVWIFLASFRQGKKE